MCDKSAHQPPPTVKHLSKHSEPAISLEAVKTVLALTNSDLLPVLDDFSTIKAEIIFTRRQTTSKRYTVGQFSEILKPLKS